MQLHFGRLRGDRVRHVAADGDAVGGGAFVGTRRVVGVRLGRERRRLGHRGDRFLRV